MKSPEPPRLAARILELVLPDEDREGVLGDLAEEFREVRVPRDGLRRARLWYLRQVAESLWPLITIHGIREVLPMRGLGRDLRVALRVFRRSPGFAATVLLTVAIGVGGATAVFSVIRGVLLTELPFPESERVVMLWGQTPTYPRSPLTVGDYNDLKAAATSFESVASVWGNNAPLVEDIDPEQVSVGWVTPGYFDMVRVPVFLGDALDPDDPDGIVISHGLWTRRYGSDPGVLGRVVSLGGVNVQIVGVLPPDMDPNLTGFSGGMSEYQVWRNQPPGWTQGDDRSVGWLRPAARLRPGVSVAQAQAEVDAVITEVNSRVTERDGGADLRVNVAPVRADLTKGLSRTLWILLGAVGGVLLIAASNVAHLMLGRAETRAEEVAVRAALGGGRSRLLRQFLVESGVLALAGGALGVGLAWVGTRLLLSWAPASLPRIDTVGIDPLVLGFALVATFMAALLFGLGPALRATRTDLATVMGERSGTSGRGRRRLSQGLVVAEVAMSLGLLVGTGLLLRSFASLKAVDLGFQPEGVVTFSLAASAWGETAEEGAAKLTDYVNRIESIPGVRSAGVTNRIPLGGGIFTGSMRSEEMVGAEVEAFMASFRYVTPGYLETLGARLLSGRMFTAADGVGAVVIDERAAERAWPSVDPVGRRIEINALGAGEPEWGEVIGVVAAMKHEGVAEEASETVYQSMLPAAHQQNFRYVAVRVNGEPMSYADPIRQVVSGVDATTVIARIRPMEQLFDESVASTRFATMLLAVFGGLAVVLAAVGLYGVMAFAVRQRTREFGIRVALGAEHGSILADVLRSGVLLVAAGVVLGTVVSLSLGRVLSALLYEVTPTDPLTLSGAALAMLTVGVLGAYLPARVVLGVDPVRALKDE